MKQTQRVPQAAVIAVGDELFQDRLDTNSQMIQDSLAAAGIATGLRVVVPDDTPAVTAAVRDAMDRFQWVICCGGLGPTVDDITRDAIASATQRRLRLHPGTMEKLRRFFKARGVAMPKSNSRQAMIPQGAKILPNEFGTAPGFSLPVPGGMVAALPGPPNECQPMLENQLLPLLRRKTRRLPLLQTLRISGSAESYLQEAVGPIFEKDPTIRLGFLIDEPGEILIKLNAMDPDPAQAKKHLSVAARKVVRRLGDWVVDSQGRSMEDVLGRWLKKHRQTVSVAESCTGGLIASRITAQPGSSAYFTEGAVTYANHAKMNRLGVKQATLLAEGAVSRAVAAEMARGMKKSSATDWALAVTGIAGPGGGSRNKPVGLVYAAIAGPDGCHGELKMQLPGKRRRIQAAAASYALGLLLRTMKAYERDLTTKKRQAKKTRI